MLLDERAAVPEEEDRPQGVHMWTPLKLHITEEYTYVPDAPLFQAGSALIRSLAYSVLPYIHRSTFRLQIEGREKLAQLEGGAVTVCNHVHILDCSMVACAFDSRRLYFPTLKSNLEIPFIRHLVRLLGGFPIPTTVRSMACFSDTVRGLLHDGKIVHLFPEGELLPYYDGVRPFKKGAFTFAYDCRVPIVPFVITYRPVYGPARLTHRRPYLTLHVLDPIYPRYEDSRTAEIERLRLTCLTTMREAYMAYDLQAWEPFII